MGGGPVMRRRPPHNMSEIWRMHKSGRRRPRTYISLAAGLALGAASLAAAPAAARADGAAQNASVVMYHRFGEDRYPATNVTLKQFDSHVRELTSGAYTVLPLAEITARLQAGGSLPDRTVGISIDDAYSSVFEHAWPRLKEAGLPFTLFIATDAVDRGLRGHMSWDQIRELRAAGVSIGSQTASHLHMPAASPSKNRKEIEISNQRFIDELGEAPALFAYPYGEASREVIRLVEQSGFSAAFGQHSGIIHPSLGFYYLPRFAMNENFGDVDRLRLAVNALPIPVEGVTPADPLITAKNPPNMGFTVTAPVPGLARLACFASHEGRARVERLGDARFEIRVNGPFPAGRTRVNCTAPSGDGRWHWFGRQFFVKR